MNVETNGVRTDFLRWMERHRAELADVTPINLTVAHAQVAIHPAAPADLVAEHMRKLAARLVDGSDAAVRAQLDALTGDDRLAGWVRLWAALLVDDREAVARFGRHAGMLASLAAGSVTSVDVSGAAMALSPLRRVRLCQAGVLSGEHLSVEQLADTAGRLASTVWWDGRLDGQVRWSATSPAGALAAVGALSLPAVSKWDLVISCAVAFEVFDDAELLDRFAEFSAPLLAGVDAACLPRLRDCRWDSARDADVVRLVEAGHRRFAALVARRRCGADALVALASDDDCSWALPDVAITDEQLMPALLAVLRRGGLAAAGAVRLAAGALADVRGLPALAVEVDRSVPSLAWMVPLAAAKQLAASHGYGSDGHLAASLPVSVKAGVVSASWRREMSAEAKALIALVGAPSAAELDLAAAVLAQARGDAALRFVPPAGVMVAGWADKLIDVLVSLVHRAQMGYHAPFATPQERDVHVSGWISALSSSDVNGLLDALRSAGFWHPCVEAPIDAALSAASPEVARALADVLFDPTRFAGLDQMRTLAAYARALSLAAARR